MGAFRAPTLRNVAVTAPYMHDGSIATLAEVIDFYAPADATSKAARTPATVAPIRSSARRSTRSISARRRSSTSSRFCRASPMRSTSSADAARGALDSCTESARRLGCEQPAQRATATTRATNRRCVARRTQRRRDGVGRLVCARPCDRASDLDLVLFYEETQPPTPARLNDIVAALAPDATPTFTQIGEWGPWVNGGAWLSFCGPAGRRAVSQSAAVPTCPRRLQ